MHAREYLSRTGLDLSVAVLSQAQSAFSKVLEVAKSKGAASNPGELYAYKVPKLSVDGICSLRGEFEAKPYDLAAVLGGRSPLTTARLAALDSVVGALQESLHVDWLGVYQARRTHDAVLVKLAYRGNPSRAEFPLTAAFAAKSNNSAVAMSGKARIINDVMAHLAKGGAYYECDPNVQAEACLPIFEGESVIGIIDAEHSAKHAFSIERTAMLVAFCLELPTLLPTGGAPVRG
jgi:putative methionine-R-sulfoxide reductase with GAF domain